jgi:hypothetical protein
MREEGYFQASKCTWYNLVGSKSQPGSCQVRLVHAGNYKETLGHLPRVCNKFLFILFIFTVVYLCQERKHMSTASVTRVTQLSNTSIRRKIGNKFPLLVRCFRRQH